MDDDVWLRQSKVEVSTRFETDERGRSLFSSHVSSSNNTYFDVLRIVQHLINPHVAAPLSKRHDSETEPTRLRSASGTVDVPLESDFESFKNV